MPTVNASSYYKLSFRILQSPVLHVVCLLKQIIWRRLCPVKLQQLTGKKKIKKREPLGVSAGKMANSQLFSILTAPSEPLQMHRAAFPVTHKEKVPSHVSLLDTSDMV